MTDHTGPDRRQYRNGITLQTFKQLPVESKLDVLFDYQIAMLSKMPFFRCTEECQAMQRICDERIKKLEKRKWLNTAASAAGGFIGGFVAVLASAWTSIFPD